MKFELYYYLLIFLNFICILSIKFEAQKFTSPKYFRIKSCVIIFISFFSLVNKIWNGLKTFTSYVHVSKFTLYFTFLFYSVLLIILISWILILLWSQKTISKILTIFLAFKKFCDERKFKINLKKIKHKVCLTFCILLCIVLTIFIDPIIKAKLDLINILITFFYLFFYTWCFWFFHVILIHCEFLIENLNEILKNNLSLIHNKCEHLHENLIKLKILFNLLNRAFGKIFTLIILIVLLLIIFCVS